MPKTCYNGQTEKGERRGGWIIAAGPDPSLRVATLDPYFDELTVAAVEQSQGWAQTQTLPSLWAQWQD